MVNVGVTGRDGPIDRVEALAVASRLLGDAFVCSAFVAVLSATGWRASGSSMAESCAALR
jgi:hypothetical protein